MVKGAANSKRITIAVTFVIVMLGAAMLVTDYLVQPNSAVPNKQNSNQPYNPSSSADNNTSGMQVTSFYLNHPDSPSNITPVSLNNPASSNLNMPVYSILSYPNSGQTTGSDTTPPTNIVNINQTESENSGNPNNSSTPITKTATPLNNSNFTTYSYGGCAVQQLDPNQLAFTFPNCTNNGLLAGSDAASSCTFPIQKMDFDAVFVAPENNALGFDEMVIFAASNTTSFKGIEFGVRMDLGNGSICGYIQEPNGTGGDVDFQMQKLMPNDGILHHYSLGIDNSTVLFKIDGVDYGSLNFQSNSDYSSLNFSILAAVHRFTDNWISMGYSMTVGNFTITQP